MAKHYDEHVISYWIRAGIYVFGHAYMPTCQKTWHNLPAYKPVLVFLIEPVKLFNMREQSQDCLTYMCAIWRLRNTCVQSQDHMRPVCPTASDLLCTVDFTSL